MRHFLPRTGASPRRLLRSLTFRSIRRSTFGSIRIINGLNVWCWTHAFDAGTSESRRETTWRKRTLWRPSLRRVRRDGTPQAVFDRLLPRCRAGASPIEKALKTLASLARKASLSPIRFTSRQEKADAFAHESGQFTAQVFRALSHQSPHQHWEQDEIHENLRGGEASFRAEGAL